MAQQIDHDKGLAVTGVPEKHDDRTGRDKPLDNPVFSRWGLEKFAQRNEGLARLYRIGWPRSWLVDPRLNGGGDLGDWNVDPARSVEIAINRKVFHQQILTKKVGNAGDKSGGRR